MARTSSSSPREGSCTCIWFVWSTSLRRGTPLRQLPTISSRGVYRSTLCSMRLRLREYLRGARGYSRHPVRRPRTAHDPGRRPHASNRLGKLCGRGQAGRNRRPELRHRSRPCPRAGANEQTISARSCRSSCPLPVTPLQRYSEPYNATGGLAAEGVINQLGRPDIEPLEVLVREAIQNCWDAKRDDSRRYSRRGRTQVLDAEAVAACTAARCLSTRRPDSRSRTSSFPGSRSCTSPTSAPTVSAAQPAPTSSASIRDFVDFVRNIGQPPDKDLGGGSFGYGKAAFYIASRARTILVDTLCRDHRGSARTPLHRLCPRRQLRAGRPALYGSPLVGPDGRAAFPSLRRVTTRTTPRASRATATSRHGRARNDGRDRGPKPRAGVGRRRRRRGRSDDTMTFIADALAWNFWPRMIDTPGGAQRTMRLSVTDQGRRVPCPESTNASPPAGLRRGDGPPSGGARGG